MSDRPPDPSDEHARALRELDERVLEALRAHGPVAAERVLADRIDDAEVGAEVARRLARWRAQLGERDGALSALRDAQHRFPEDVALWVDEGALLALEEPRRAEALFEKLRERSPERADVVAWLSELRVGRDPEAALVLAEEAVALDERLARGHVARVECLMALGRGDEVELALDGAIQRIPDHAGLRLLRALWRADAFDDEGSLSDLNAAAAMEPGHPGLDATVWEIVRRRDRWVRGWTRLLGRVANWDRGRVLLGVVVLGLTAVGMLQLSTVDGLGWVRHLVLGGLLGLVWLAQAGLLAPALLELLLERDPLGRQLLDERDLGRARWAVGVWLGGGASIAVGWGMARPIAGLWGVGLALLAPPLWWAMEARPSRRRGVGRAGVAVALIGLGGSMALTTQGEEASVGLAVVTLWALAWVGLAARWLGR